MYTKRYYGFWLTLNWSKMPLIWGFIYASAVTIAYTLCKKYAGFELIISWQPTSVLGIAVAFYLGFKNNASYDRTWEARKIWGSIVNNSRTFGNAINAFVQGENSDKVKKELLYRHIAWLTALRFQLRLTREWEHIEDRIKGIYYPETSDKYFADLDNELAKYVPEGEVQTYLSKTNIATQILTKQGQRLQELCNQGYFEDYRHMGLFSCIFG
jgi:putative membrane protein